MALLSSGEAGVVRALCDTFLRPLSEAEALEVARSVDGSTPSPAQLAGLMAGGASESVLAAFERSLGRLLAGERSDVRLLLGLLGTRVGTCALTGLLGRAFADRDARDREAAMLGMARSSVALRRKAVNALRRLCAGVSALALDDATRGNPVHAAAGWRGPPASLFGAEAPPPDSEGEADWPRGALDEAYDVVIVGSGCGGSVAASHLSAAGYRVLVLEKAERRGPSDFDGEEGPAFERLYERSALVATRCGSLGVLAGSAFGGGSTINWACSLRTPRRVQDEWRDVHGLRCCRVDEATGRSALDGALDAVCERLGVTDAGVTHNFPNAALLRGAEALGLPARTLPQNLKRTDEGAFYVAYGDRFGNKQSTPVTWLRDAARTGRCFFRDRVAALHVLRDDAGRCAGVRCADGATGSVVDVTARRAVVLSGGSLHTPAILLRTPGGFPNANVGHYLRLHPVTALTARFPGEDPGRASRSGFLAFGDGAPMTAACEACVDGPLGDGYGALLEVPHAGLGLAVTASPWLGAKETKALVYGAKHLVSVIVLQRDATEGGRVVLDADGEPQVDYELAPRDAASMTDALVTAGRVLAAAGAASLRTMPLADPPTADLTEGGSGALDAWERAVRARGLASDNRSTLLSAHQMGTCRMGASDATSVVDETGESWECPGLFVCDASLLPTASGVNPMLTTMALATLVSHALVAALDKEGGPKKGHPKGGADRKVARWRRKARAKAATRAAAAAAAVAVAAILFARRRARS